MNNEDLKIKTGNNDIVRCTLYGREHIEKGRCVIFVHGFKGFKDWGFVPYIGEYFSKQGISLLTFNFSHNGIGEDPQEFTELEKFAENTYSLELSELNSVLDALLSCELGEIANPKIGLLGHSRGGGVAAITAWKRKEISALALWASISRVDRYSQNQKARWRQKGYMEVKNMRTSQIMRTNLSLLEDIENNKDALNIKNAVKLLNRPLFIAHADQDMAVSIKEAEELYNVSNKEMTEYIRLSNTGHTFNIKHPFEGSNEKFEELMYRTYSFFNFHLK